MVTGKQNRQDPDGKTTIKHKMITKCQEQSIFALLENMSECTTHTRPHARTNTHTHTLNNHTLTVKNLHL